MDGAPRERTICGEADPYLMDLSRMLDLEYNMQNVAFETLGDNFLDFTESNPFGDPSETF